MEQQQMMEMQMEQMAGGIGVGMIILWLVLYVFFAYCLARLAVKRGMPFGSSFIWAIIPIANVFLLLKLGDKPMWWFILMLIPLVNFVILIILWMAICEKLGKPGWWGIMISLVPIANLVFFLMLVFGKEEARPATA
ncbi:MAG TPA: DUF5684 domain-containing protein [bacterium]|nr:DUF5684 domain-containing protein [bacterium]